MAAAGKGLKKFEMDSGVIYHGDCLDVMRSMKRSSVDLVLGSPPYEDVRSYGELDFRLSGEEWVSWMVEVFKASLRVSKGLVAFVVGHGKGFRDWSAVPALLVADLKRGGVCLRSPLIYKRNGIMGSGGSDWFRADYEWIICAVNNDGPLPWSDNTACGHPPKCPAGGKPSHRTKDGRRVSDEDRARLNDLIKRLGLSQREAARRLNLEIRVTTNSGKNGDTANQKTYVAPEKANPGNVIDCGAVGGGHLGSHISHENEAPFPEKVPDFFIRSCCPPNGIVFDPFIGSGTTLAVAVKTGRRFIGCDNRESQVKLTKRRLEQARLSKGFGL